MKVGDLVQAKDGRIVGMVGLVTEIKPIPHKRRNQGTPTVAVLWRDGEHQRWINPQFLRVINESR